MKQLIKKLLREHTIRSLKVKVDRLFGKNSIKTASGNSSCALPLSPDEKAGGRDEGGGAHPDPVRASLCRDCLDELPLGFVPEEGRVDRLSLAAPVF